MPSSTAAITSNNNVRTSLILIVHLLLGKRELAHPTRRRILELLREGNCTAGELAKHFDISKPSLSHHLATLKNAGLVTDEHHGQNIVYSLNTTVMQDLIGWFMGFTNNEGDKDE